jgi:hypothetical protein
MLLLGKVGSSMVVFALEKAGKGFRVCLSGTIDETLVMGLESGCELHNIMN